MTNEELIRAIGILRDRLASGAASPDDVALGRELSAWYAGWQAHERRFGEAPARASVAPAASPLPVPVVAVTEPVRRVMVPATSQGASVVERDRTYANMLIASPGVWVKFVFTTAGRSNWMAHKIRHAVRPPWAVENGRFEVLRHDKFLRVRYVGSTET